MSTFYENGYVFYRGKVFSVEWYFTAEGESKARGYYQGLSQEEKDRLSYIVKYIADNPIGTRLPKTLYNLESSDNKIYAFKPKDHRFFNFMVAGKRIIILGAYRKHSQQMTKKDLNLLQSAVDAKHDYLKRTGEGTYYEGFA